MLFNTSCVTQKPYAESVSQPDYNHRIKVDKPGFIKKENALGVTFSIGMAGVGGYFGYNADIIKLPNGNENLSKTGNAVLGTILGYSISRIGTHIAGKNKVNSYKNKDQWLKKLDDDFSIINQNNNQVTLINKKVETVYDVRDYNDIIDFKKAFPNSNNNEVMLSKALSIVKRDEIPSILKMYPNVNIADTYKLKYYELSKNVSELKRAKSFYPEIKERFNICKNINKIISVSDKSELDYLIQEYVSSHCIESIYNAYVEECTGIEDCYNMSKKYPNLIEPLSLKAISYANTTEDFNELYKKFPNKKSIIETKAISSTSSLEDLKNIYNSFKDITIERKMEIEDKALTNAVTLDQLSKLYNEFNNSSVDFKDKIEIKVLSLASTISDYSKIFKGFKGISIIAEHKALEMATSLETRKEFYNNFPDSVFSPNIYKMIQSEEKNIQTFNKIADETGDKIQDKYRYKYNNYAINDLDFGMTSYTYEKDFVRISAFVTMYFYISFGGEEGSENKFVQLLNIFSNFSSRSGGSNKRHKVDITYDILLFKNNNIELSNYQASGLSNLESSDRGISNIGNWARKELREMAKYNSDYYYVSTDGFKPCYSITDKSTNFINGTVTYVVKCRNGSSEIINYYPDKGTYSAAWFGEKDASDLGFMGLTPSNATFMDAINNYCGCK